MDKATLDQLEQVLVMCESDKGHNPGLISLPTHTFRQVWELAQSTFAAARPAVVSDEVVEAMCEAYEAEFGRTYFKGRAARIAAMRAALALLPGVVPDREAISSQISDWVDRALATHGRFDSLELADAIIAMLSASPKGASVAESAAGDASHLTASETPCKSEGA